MEEDKVNFYKNLEKTELWRTIVGFILFIIFVLIFYGVLFYIWSLLDHLAFLNNDKIRLILLFGSFVSWHVALIILISIFHKRSYVSLIGVNKRINWKQVLAAIIVSVLISVIGLIVTQFEGFIFEQKTLPRIEILSFNNWLPWVLPALAVIFIQVSAEELLFRGYLLQQLRSRFQSYWIWLVFPSILFGIAHYDFNTYGFNTLFYMFNAFTFGILASILTVIANNISYALGMHFVNNVLGILFFGMGDTLSQLSLVTYYFDKTGIYMTYIIIFQTALQIITFLILFYRLKGQKY